MNGWKNWETWESFNLVTSFEDLYFELFDDLETTEKQVLRVLKKAVKRTGQDENYIDFNKVDFTEITNNLNEV